MTTIFILLAMGFGTMVGLCLAMLVIPSGINDAWHEGYEEARKDFADPALGEPAIARKKGGPAK